LGKCTASKQQDQAALTESEKKLKSETEIRSRVEMELREYQHASRNSYSAEEVKVMNDKLRKTEKDLDSTRKELLRKDKSCEELRKELTAQRKAYRLVETEKQQLTIALADETRVKIELFTALSEAGRKQQGLVDECHRKNLEIGRLRQNLAEIMAIIPTHPSTPQPTTTANSPMGGAMAASPRSYPPASSPQN
jgi:chromosome segregation ATPase